MTVKSLVSRPMISTVTFASVIPVRFLTSLSSTMLYVFWNASVKSVRSIVPRTILFMPASIEVSPARVMEGGSIFMTVFAEVAPAPSMVSTVSGTSLTIRSGSVAFIVSVEQVMPVVEHSSPLESISV